MSDFKLKEDHGSAFANKRKSKDTDPDFTGGINIAGTEYWINVWKNKDRNGNTYVSFIKGNVREERPPREVSVDREYPDMGDDPPPF